MFRKAIALLCLYSALPVAAYAGEAAPGMLNTVHFFINGIVIAYTNGTRTNVPGCATQSTRFAMDSTTAGGKSQLAGLLAAYASKTPVQIYGTGNCSVHGDTETISYFYTVD